MEMFKEILDLSACHIYNIIQNYVQVMIGVFCVT